MMRSAGSALVACATFGACGTTHQLGSPLTDADVGAIQRSAARKPLDLAYAPPAAPRGTERAPAPLVHPLAARYGSQMRALVRREGDALVFQSRTGELVSIPDQDLRAIETRDHLAGAGWGLLLGFVGGAALGAAVGASGQTCNDDNPCGGPATRGAGALLGATLGGLLGVTTGALLGAIIGTSVRYQLPSGSPGDARDEACLP